MPEEDDEIPKEGPSGVVQLQQEIDQTIKRAALESDVNVAEAIGVLEIIKASLIRGMLEDGEESEEGEEGD